MKKKKKEKESFQKKKKTNKLILIVQYMSPHIEYIWQVHVPVIAFPTTGEVVPEPLGVVLIFSSWNFPLGEL